LNRQQLSVIQLQIRCILSSATAFINNAVFIQTRQPSDWVSTLIFSKSEHFPGLFLPERRFNIYRSVSLIRWKRNEWSSLANESVTFVLQTRKNLLLQLCRFENFAAEVNQHLTIQPHAKIEITAYSVFTHFHRINFERWRTDFHSGKSSRHFSSEN
jgi:hypothetical protein